MELQLSSVWEGAAKHRDPQNRKIHCVIEKHFSTENCNKLTTFPVRPHNVNISKLLSVIWTEQISWLTWRLLAKLVKKQAIFCTFCKQIIYTNNRPQLYWLIRECCKNVFNHKYKMMMYNADSDLLVEICSPTSRWILIKCQYVSIKHL